jgi:hypothetical protein
VYHVYRNSHIITYKALNHRSKHTCSWWSRKKYFSCNIISKFIHSPIFRFWSGCISSILGHVMSHISWWYSGHIIRILVTFPKIFIICMVLTNEVIKTHACSNNHILLVHWVTWHIEKNSLLHFPHTKGSLYNIVNTWMQMIKELLLTTWSWTPPPIWHMISLTLVWCQVCRSVWISSMSIVIFFQQRHVKNWTLREAYSCKFLYMYNIEKWCYQHTSRRVWKYVMIMS